MGRDDPEGGRTEAEAGVGTRLGRACPSSKEVRMSRVEGFLASTPTESGARRVGLAASAWPSCEYENLIGIKFYTRIIILPVAVTKILCE